MFAEQCCIALKDIKQVSLVLSGGGGRGRREENPEKRRTKEIRQRIRGEKRK